jgi:hypothetical protein
VGVQPGGRTGDGAGERRAGKLGKRQAGAGGAKTRLTPVGAL